MTMGVCRHRTSLQAPFLFPLYQAGVEICVSRCTRLMIIYRKDVIRMVAKFLIAVAALMSAAIMYCCIRVGALSDRHMERMTKKKGQEAADDG